ncbi:MAG: hypothetical protein ACI9F9_000462 [Candidatus Paceibacteria bacterium]|jgi:hypothetical protein
MRSAGRGKRGSNAGALELLFFVRDVLAAEAAILVLLELVPRLQTLVRRVVAVLALGALEKDVAFFDLHLTIFKGQTRQLSPPVR